MREQTKAQTQIKTQAQRQATLDENQTKSAELLRHKIEGMDAMKKGKNNLITDVAGVRVGHYTINDGKHQTGVTVVLPVVDNIYLNKCVSNVEIINGFGKSAGLVQLNELGQLESPIALTSTLNVGKVCDALVSSTIEACQADAYDVMTFNPIVAECNDSYLNAIQTRLIGYDEVKSAMASATEVFDQGAVGAGRGMSCHGLKGGIGSASRMISIDEKEYTLGVLVQANHGKLEDLVVAGEPMGKSLTLQVESLLEKYQRALKKDPVKKEALNNETLKGTLCKTLDIPQNIPQNMSQEKDVIANGNDKALEHAIEKGEMGSIIVVMATDLPISALQIKRILKRATVGISRVGGYIHHGSGEIAIGFTTANRVPHQDKGPYLDCKIITDQWIDQAFRAMAEATEEAILKTLCHAETVVGRAGHCRVSLVDALAEQPIL